MQREERGIYFLANDRIIDRTIAFLNSVRKYNPAIPLQMIPFDDDIDRLIRLQEKYAFTVWNDQDALALCDGISRSFHGRVWGHFRKLAAWAGDFGQFIYIDSDTVVLRNLDPIFNYLCDVGFLCALSNVSSIRKWVWKDTIYQTDKLTAEQIDFAASTGFMCSATENLSLQVALDKMPAGLGLAEHMELLCPEQGFLNYLFVTSGQAYTSLRALSDRNGSVDIPLERHSNEPFKTGPHGVITYPATPPTLLVHWAGDWQALERSEKHQLDHQELWDYYRHLSD